MGDAEHRAAADHGVFVLGNTVRAVHQRAVALEQRCRHGLHCRNGGGGRPGRPAGRGADARSTGNEFEGFWEAMVRQELAADPSLLE